MRTAEEILEKNGFNIEDFKIDCEYSAKNLIAAINEARKEAIQLCAHKADELIICPKGSRSEMSIQILSLIKELK